MSQIVIFIEYIKFPALLPPWYQQIIEQFETYTYDTSTLLCTQYLSYNYYTDENAKN